MKIMSIFANKEPCMGNFIKQQEERKDAKERDRLRRDKIAGYFFQPFTTHICCTGIRHYYTYIH